MSGQWHGGKGSAPRKQQDKKAYDEGYERIFGNKRKRNSSDSEGDSNTRTTDGDATQGSSGSDIPKT